MAYMSQENKAKLAPGIKAVLAKYGLKGSISVDNHSTLCVTIKSGKIDFMSDAFDINTNPNNPSYIGKPDWHIMKSKPDCIDVNQYWLKNNHSGIALECLTELVNAMNVGNWDKSDSSIDYFNVGWYISIHIGRWDKPYIYTPSLENVA